MKVVFLTEMSTLGLPGSENINVREKGGKATFCSEKRELKTESQECAEVREP